LKRKDEEFVEGRLFNRRMEQVEADLREGPSFEFLVLMELRGIAESLRKLEEG
jgi:hypothetical protein